MNLPSSKNKSLDSVEPLLSLYSIRTTIPLRNLLPNAVFLSIVFVVDCGVDCGVDFVVDCVDFLPILISLPLE